MNFSPIVLFAYNRPKHTQRTLDALAVNPEAKESELFIFCDGPKVKNTDDELENIKQVLAIANSENRFKKVEVRAARSNKGLANSIIEGVSEIVGTYGSIIVLEDDIATSSGFLKYMNDALNIYRDNKSVMHISGYMYPNTQNLPETFFYNVPLCWGWATWSRSWQHFNSDGVFLWNQLKKKHLLSNLDKFGSDYLSSQLADNITGKLHTWFVKWHASVLLQNGYTLFPKQSLVQNFGFDNTGEHNGVHTEFNHKKLIQNIDVKPIDLVENKNAQLIIANFYKSIKKKPSSKSIKKTLKNKLRKASFLVFPELKKVLKYNQNIVQSKTYLGKHCKIYPPSRLSNTIIGSYSYVSENSVINNTIIGKFCSIGANFMAGRGLHPTNGISTHPMFYSTAKQNGVSISLENKIEEFNPITIGNDVFIGMNVTVLDGVTIGDGAIIGAGAVVSKDIPPYAIAVGNPIEIKKYRFSEDIIQKLLKIEWWNFNDHDLALVEKNFFNIEDFINEIENKNKS
jgi:acetyltransferase-like isoleucine patch superfamily enzyme